MRVLWLSHLVPYPPKGGVLQRSFNLLREVARYNTVDLVAMVQRPLLAYLAPEREEALRIAKRELSGFCASVAFCPLPEDARVGGRTGLLLGSVISPRPYTVNWLLSRRMAGLVQRHTAARACEIAHLDTFSLGAYLDDLGGMPAVMNHHNIESHMMQRRAANESNPLKKLYMLQESAKILRWERRYGERCAAHLTCSELDTERLLQAAPRLAGKVHEIPNGVDLDYFKPDYVAPTEGRLIFAGRLSAYPNRKAVLFIARELWPALKQAIPSVSIDIIGAEPPQEVIRLAERDPAVRVHGFVDDVRPFLNGAAVYVCPITDGGGTKLKVLDALAMAKAVVADPIACEGIEVRAGTHVAFAHTVSEYVHHIRHLFAHVEERQRLGQAARALVEEKYSYRAIGMRLAEVYEDVVSRSHTRRATKHPGKGLGGGAGNRSRHNGRDGAGTG